MIVSTYFTYTAMLFSEKKIRLIQKANYIWLYKYPKTNVGNFAFVENTYLCLHNWGKNQKRSF